MAQYPTYPTYLPWLRGHRRAQSSWSVLSALQPEPQDPWLWLVWVLGELVLWNFMCWVFAHAIEAHVKG